MSMRNIRDRIVSIVMGDVIKSLEKKINNLDDESDIAATKLYEIRKLAGQYKNSLTIGTATLANSIIEILDDTK